MKINIIPIGTSKGIRIPQTVLKQCNIKDSVEMEIRGTTILIKPSLTQPRGGWEDACKKMHDNKDDRPLLDDTVDLDMEEWEW